MPNLVTRLNGMGATTVTEKFGSAVDPSFLLLDQRYHDHYINWRENVKLKKFNQQIDDNIAYLHISAQ